METYFYVRIVKPPLVSESVVCLEIKKIIASIIIVRRQRHDNSIQTKPKKKLFIRKRAPRRTPVLSIQNLQNTWIIHWFYNRTSDCAVTASAGRYRNVNNFFFFNCTDNYLVSRTNLAHTLRQLRFIANKNTIQIKNIYMYLDRITANRTSRRKYCFSTIRFRRAWPSPRLVYRPFLKHKHQQQRCDLRLRFYCSKNCNY